MINASDCVDEAAMPNTPESDSAGGRGPRSND
jgi:hypothetical protein